MQSASGALKHIAPDELFKKLNELEPKQIVDYVQGIYVDFPSLQEASKIKLLVDGCAELSDESAPFFVQCLIQHPDKFGGQTVVDQVMGAERIAGLIKVSSELQNFIKDQVRDRKLKQLNELRSKADRLKSQKELQSKVKQQDELEKLKLHVQKLKQAKQVRDEVEQQKDQRELARIYEDLKSEVEEYKTKAYHQISEIEIQLSDINKGLEVYQSLVEAPKEDVSSQINDLIEQKKEIQRKVSRLDFALSAFPDDKNAVGEHINDLRSNQIWKIEDDLNALKTSLLKIQDNINANIVEAQLFQEPIQEDVTSAQHEQEYDAILSEKKASNVLNGLIDAIQDKIILTMGMKAVEEKEVLNEKVVEPTQNLSLSNVVQIGIGYLDKFNDLAKNYFNPEVGENLEVPSKATTQVASDRVEINGNKDEERYYDAERYHNKGRGWNYSPQNKKQILTPNEALVEKIEKFQGAMERMDERADVYQKEKNLVKLKELQRSIGGNWKKNYDEMVDAHKLLNEEERENLTYDLFACEESLVRITDKIQGYVKDMQYAVWAKKINDLTDNLRTMDTESNTADYQGLIVLQNKMTQLENQLTKIKQESNSFVIADDGGQGQHILELNNQIKRAESIKSAVSLKINNETKNRLRPYVNDQDGSELKALKEIVQEGNAASACLKSAINSDNKLKCLDFIQEYVKSMNEIKDDTRLVQHLSSVYLAHYKELEDYLVSTSEIQRGVDFNTVNASLGALYDSSNQPPNNSEHSTFEYLTRLQDIANKLANTLNYEFNYTGEFNYSNITKPETAETFQANQESVQAVRDKIAEIINLQPNKAIMRKALGAEKQLAENGNIQDVLDTFGRNKRVKLQKMAPKFLSSMFMENRDKQVYQKLKEIQRISDEFNKRNQHKMSGEDSNLHRSRK